MITMKMLRDRLNRDRVYKTQEFWDELAEQHYSDKGTLSWKNPHLNEILQRVESDIITSWTRDIRGCAVLDLGCGGGRFAREFAKRGARVHGIDFSAKSIEIARKITGEGDVSYSVSSIYDLDQTDAYDYVIVSKVVTVACSNAEALRICLAKIKKALKPGGKVIFVEPLHRSFLRRILRMSLPQFVAELRQAGFAVLEARGAEFAPARLALAFFAWPRWITYPAYAAGKSLLALLPSLADQKFILAQRPQ